MLKVVLHLVFHRKQAEWYQSKIALEIEEERKWRVAREKGSVYSGYQTQYNLDQSGPGGFEQYGLLLAAPLFR